MRLRLLGAMDVSGPTGGDARPLLAQPKRFALLAYLACTVPGGFIRRDILLALFWPELDEPHARTALRNALYAIRQQVGPDVIVNRGDDELGTSAKLICDVATFVTAATDGDFRRALALYGGAFLPGFVVTGAPEFEVWASAERRRLGDLAGATAWQGAQAAAVARSVNEARLFARQAAELAPFDESMQQRVIALLDDLGDRASALQQYERFREQLARELEADPSPATEALMVRLRARAPPAARAAAGAPEPVPAASLPRAFRGGAMPPPVPESGPRYRSTSWRWAVVGLVIVVVGVTTFAGRQRGWLGAGRRGDTGAADFARLAVLPLVNTTGDSTLNVAATGLAHRTADAIAASGATQVIATSVAEHAWVRAGGDRADARALGRELGATAVLEWHLARQQHRVILRGELLSVADGTQLLAVNDTTSRDSLAIVERWLSTAIAQVVRTKTVLARTARSAGTDDALARVAVIKGRHFVDRADTAYLRRALQFADEAVNRDPGYAEAHALLADVYSALATNELVGADDAWPRARAAAARALALDSTLVSPRKTRAFARATYDRQYADAERELRELVRREPDEPNNLFVWGIVLGIMGRYEGAIEALREAERLDPLNPRYPMWLSRWQLVLERCTDAAAAARRVLALDADGADPHDVLAAVAVRRRRYDDAMTERLAALSGTDVALRQEFTPVRGTRERYARLETAAVRRVLDRWRTDTSHFRPARIGAEAAATLGMRDSAFAYLAVAERQRSTWLLAVRWLPAYDRVRADARYTALVGRLGLPVEQPHPPRGACGGD